MCHTDANCSVPSTLLQLLLSPGGAVIGKAHLEYQNNELELGGPTITMMELADKTMPARFDHSGGKQLCTGSTNMQKALHPCCSVHACTRRPGLRARVTQASSRPSPCMQGSALTSPSLPRAAAPGLLAHARRQCLEKTTCDISIMITT